jgi:DNA repair protein RadA/Sms
MGGIRASEPAVDLAVALAVASSFLDTPLPQGTVAVGEIGLSGEVRGVRDLERRLEEASRLGFRHAIVHASKDVRTATPMQLLPVRDVTEALAHLDRPSRNSARVRVESGAFTPRG